MRKVLSRAKTAKKVGKVAGLSKTKKFGGKTYTKTSCSTSLTEARKKAESVRKSGGSARVVKNVKGSGGCVYTRSSK